MAVEMETRNVETERTEPASPPVPLTADEKMVLLVSGMSKKDQVARLCREMGISRKQYYKLLKRAKRALLEAVEPRRQGRKRKIADPEKEALKKQVKSLRRKLVRTETLLAVAQKIARDHPLGFRAPIEKKRMDGRRMTGRPKR